MDTLNVEVVENWPLISKNVDDARWQKSDPFSTFLLTRMRSSIVWKWPPRAYAAFRLVCRSRYCCFDGDFCKTAQAPLAAAKGRPSGKQRLANKSIIPPLYPQWQTADSSQTLEMPFGDKTKAVWPLRAETLKVQAMIKRRSGKRQASLKLALISIASSTWAHQGAIGHGKYASIRCALGQ